MCHGRFISHCTRRDVHELPQQYGKLPAFTLDYEVLAAGTFSNKTTRLAFGVSYVFSRAFKYETFN